MAKVSTCVCLYARANCLQYVKFSNGYRCHEVHKQTGTMAERIFESVHRRPKNRPVEVNLEVIIITTIAHEHAHGYSVVGNAS